jgi:drug/metabolite transporter (DMT)-like permease
LSRARRSKPGAMSTPPVDVDKLSHPVPSRAVRGFVFAVLSGLSFTFINAAGKELASELPPLCVAWGRWIAGVAFIAPYVLWTVGAAGMRTADLRLHTFRGLLHAAGTSLLWQSVVGAVCLTPLGIWFWQTPTWPHLGLFVAAGFFGTMGYFFITWAYRLLDISALQPITFLGIVWAGLMDVALWDKTSDIWTFVGAAIIVAATTYIAHREARAGGREQMGVVVHTNDDAYTLRAADECEHRSGH